MCIFGAQTKGYYCCIYEGFESSLQMLPEPTRHWTHLVRLFITLMLDTKNVKMDLEEPHLCLFCLDLVKATSETPAPVSQRPHHATHGLLLSSSKTCVVCQLITSLWDSFDSTLSRHGLSLETLETSQLEYPLKITMQDTHREKSGVCWAFFRANLTITNTVFEFVSYFTVTTCSPEGT
jgi:hypothetical protein